MTKDQQKKDLILNNPNIYKGLIILALPIMLNNFIKTIQSVIDMYFVGDIPNYSTQAISAISLTFPVNFTYISLGIGLSAAGTALMSQLMGANKEKQAQKYAGNLLIIAFVIGVLLNIFSYFVSPYIMQIMGTEGYVLEQSSIYLRIRSFELPFVFLFFAFTSIRQSSGDTVTAVIYGVITVVLNIILSPLLISTFNLGVAGAAYATMAANIVIVPAFIYIIFFAKSGIRLRLSDLKLDSAIVEDITQKAIPASLGQSITAIGFIIMNAMIVEYSDQTVAAFSVGNRINSLILMPAMAIGGILAAYIGQNIGNQQPKRAKEAFKKAMILGISIMIVGSTIIMFLRKPLIGLFLSDDPIAFDQAYEYMFYLLLGLPMMAVFQTFIGTFNGSGKTRFTFIITVTRLWIIRIPLILLFGRFTQLDYLGIWFSMLLSNVLIVLPGIIMYKKIDFMPIVKVNKKQISEEQLREV
ncbi:MATE family efflux transporter [Mycoplasmatota bacterium]|nr:MATE family efflux transporter [Mycoplasmatota bacterium]